MIKFKIVTRSNLTLLGLAFNENKLPKAKGGEAFYDNDETNEIDNIYFLDSDYYYELLKFIELNKNTFANDKYSFQYLELFEALKKSEKVEYEIV